MKRRRKKATAFQVKRIQREKKVVMWNSCRSTSSRIMFRSEYCCDDLLRCFRATDARKQKILKIISLYSVCCVCVAVNVVYILPPSHRKNNKSMKTELEFNPEERTQMPVMLLNSLFQQSRSLNNSCQRNSKKTKYLNQFLKKKKAVDRAEKSVAFRT